MKLYLVGLNYAGDVTESDYIVFTSDKDAEDYIKKASVKMMITFVKDENLAKLKVICTKHFKKEIEDVTNEDVDKLSVKILDTVYKALEKLQDEIESYFFDEITFFTDKDEKHFSITLK